MPRKGSMHAGIEIRECAFAAVAGGREYSFSVSGEGNADLSFKVVIEKAGFRPGLLKYQDGADISFKRTGPSATCGRSFP